MIGGSLIVAVCLLVLGWTGEIVRLFVREPETVGDWNHDIYEVPAHHDYRRSHARSLWPSLVSTPWISLSMQVCALLAWKRQIARS